MKKVLYLSYDGMTEALGESQVLPYLAGMSNDVEFHLISFEKKETFEANRERIASFCKSNSIQWFPQSYTKKPPILSTLKDLKRMKQLSMELNSTLNFDLIHARSYLPAMIASVLKKKLNVPFLFDMRGFWADERVEGKIWSLGNPVFKMIFRYMKGREKKLLMHADAVISLTEKGKILLNDIAQDEQIIEKTKVIPCCVDTQRFDPSLFPENLKREIKKELEIEESSFVLGYVGSIGTWYMLDEMLLFFKTLLIQKHEATFLFVTKESTDFLIKRARFYGIDPMCIRTKFASHDKVPAYLSIFDWSIFFIRPSFSKQASSPIKQGELMAMEIPVITNNGIGDTDAIIAQWKSGICLSSLDEKSFKDIQLDDFQVNREKIREGAHHVFGLKNGVESYMKIYKEIWKK